MQSNNNPEDPEFEDILNIAYHHGELGNKNACLRPLLEKLIAREHRKTLEARIDELKSFSRDFVVQHGVVPARSVSVKKLGDRILELQSQLPKDKGEESL